MSQCHGASGHREQDLGQASRCVNAPSSHHAYFSDCHRGPGLSLGDHTALHSKVLGSHEQAPLAL